MLCKQTPLLSLVKEVLEVGTILVVVLLHLCECEEVLGAMAFGVEVLRDVHLQPVVHADVVLHALEVVVPTQTVARHHEETTETVAEEHLHLLEAAGGVVLGVGNAAGNVLALLAPLHSGVCDAVRREGARTLRERRRDDDLVLAVPGVWIVAHDAGVGNDVWSWQHLRAILHDLVGLRVDPTQRLQILQHLVIRQLLRHGHALVISDLWHQHDAPDLADLVVVLWRHTVQVTRDLGSQICDGDELRQDVLGQHVREAVLRNVLGRDVDVLGTEVQIGGADGTHAPI
eukprot:CAMPEP_0198131242 /NCGR_PEP_ID=MMETSP1442-20131203/55722_1 /TAXON_ID= /ORGANISM="Craspedostauros australis, Strain CCMP3328" /LENGTH=286 /DNA_ID=CAMNT_0043792011 /DNA_START=124 /DNA_END=981 /DNA_ORIENTATION=+